MLSTTRRIELVGKKEFAAAALDPEHETYVVYIASLSSTPLASLDVHPSREPQISGLIAEKALTKVSAEYSEFAGVFFSRFGNGTLWAYWDLHICHRPRRG